MNHLSCSKGKTRCMGRFLNPCRNGSGLPKPAPAAGASPLHPPPTADRCCGAAFLPRINILQSCTLRHHFQSVWSNQNRKKNQPKNPKPTTTPKGNFQAENLLHPLNYKQVQLGETEGTLCEPAVHMVQPQHCLLGWGSVHGKDGCCKLLMLTFVPLLAHLFQSYSNCQPRATTRSNSILFIKLSWYFHIAMAELEEGGPQPSSPLLSPCRVRNTYLA